MILGLALAAGLAPPAREVRLLMGTTAEVWVRTLAHPETAIAAAFTRLALVDDQMSLWKPSALTRLNQEGGGAPPPELLAVLRHALDVAAASDGAFDPTVEPLVRAAGGLGDPPADLGEPERHALLARVGYRRVHLDGDSVRFEPGTRLDFGGIAKGYAVDLALAALHEAGVSAALVDLGGSSIGVFGEPLTIDVRNPEAPEAEPWARFRVEGAHVATSGGDQKPGHILDPQTGLSVAKMLSATVVADTGIEADALSTAVFVLGPEAGLALLERRGAQGLVLARAGAAKVVRTTAGFADRYALETAPGVRSAP